MTTCMIVKIASFKNLLATLFSAVLMCLLLGQNVAKAQGSGSGTLDDILANAGSISNAVGSLGSLIDNFTLDGFLDFACQSATAANGIEGSGESQEAEDTICTIASMFSQVEDLFEENETTMEESQGLFAKSSLFGMNVGTLLSGNPEQLTGLLADIEEFLGEEDPSKMTEKARITFEGAALTEAQNYEFAPPGSIQWDFNAAMQYNPQLVMANTQSLYQQADLNTKRVEGMAALEGSRGIAQALSDSKSPDQLVESITPGEDKKGVAPALRDEANAAVSTRATVQEVVEAITYYMEQDVRQFAYLSEQLTLQAQQQVYTGKMLQLTADAILAEQKQENDQARAELQAAVSEVTQQVKTMADNVAKIAESVASLGTPRVIDLTDSVNALTNF